MPSESSPIRLGAAALSTLVFESGSRVTTSDSGIQACAVKGLCADGANIFNLLPAAGVPLSSVFGNGYLPGSFLVDYTDSGPEIEYLEGKTARVTITFKRQDPLQMGVRKIYTDSTINYKTLLPPARWTLATGETSEESVFGFPEPVVTVKYNSSTRPNIGSGGLSQLYATPSDFPAAPDITVPYTFAVQAGGVVSYWNGTTFVSVTVSQDTTFVFNFIFKSNPRGWQLVKLKTEPVAAATFYDVEENWRNYYIFFGVQFVSKTP